MNDNEPLSDDDVRGLATNLADERKVFEENEVEQTRRIFRQFSPVAATAICRLATNASSERMRFQASTYVLDRALGRVQDSTSPVSDSPLDLLMRDIVKDLPEADLRRMRAQVNGSTDGENDASE